MSTVKFIKLHPEAKAPSKAHPSDAAFDLVAVSERLDLEGRYIEYGLGLALELPENFCAKLYPRSSISNKDIVLSNSTALIDQNYRGELKVRFKSLIQAGARKYKVGDKVVQLKIEPVDNTVFVESDTLSETDRGSGGFGSTGV